MALQQTGQHVVFVSKDLNARIKSDVLGIQTEDFQNQKVDAERLYTGYVEASVPGDLIDELYAERMLSIDKVDDTSTRSVPEGGTIEHEVIPNQFMVIRDATDESHTGLARRLADTEHLIPVTGAAQADLRHHAAATSQQTMALDLLLDDEIRLVTLLGSAGTGKTLLALAAGMHEGLQGGALRQAAGRAADHADGPRHRLPARATRTRSCPLDAADLRQPRSSCSRPEAAPRRSAESHTIEQRIERCATTGVSCSSR